MEELVAHVKNQVFTDRPAKTGLHPTKSKLFVLPHYPPRDRIMSHGPKPGGSPTQFSVVSYNILADCYAKHAGYWYCTTLSPLLRHDSLMKELSALSYGCVLCFQEVTERYFSSLLLPSLRAMGYEGVFQQKNKSHRKSAKSEDGLATFYRLDKCVLLASQSVVLNDLMANAWKHKIGNNRMADMCYRDTVSLLTAFSIEDKIVSIANVHIHFDWMRPDVQALQACLVMSKLVEFANTYKSCGYLYCGDFNSQPSTALYQLLTGGALTVEMRAEFLHSSLPVPVKKTDLLFKTTTESIPFFEIFQDSYRISETVKSAYLTVQGYEPYYTNYTADFHGCLDYIFYSDGLSPTSVLSLPDERELRSEVALPNSVMSSDHLSIKAEFRIAIYSGEDKQIEGKQQT